MTKAEVYRQTLASLKAWDEFLLKESGLPGARANLELVNVVAEMGEESQFTGWLLLNADRAPSNTPQEFLALCGVVGLGKLVAGDGSVSKKNKYLKTLRACASDPRWRVREGVALALQRWGDKDFGAVIDEMKQWRDGNLYAQRAIAAALCEPRLLKNRAHVKQVLRLLDGITRDFSKTKNRKGDDFLALKKGLGYCWSVAVAASPDDGKQAMEKWFESDDADVRAVMRENLKKDRLKRMDAAWVKQWESV